MVSNDTHLGIIVGGFLPIPSELYSANGTERRADVAHRALCSSSTITEFHGTYNITRSFAFSAIANHKFAPRPVSCTAVDQLAHECKYTTQYVPSLLNICDFFLIAYCTT